ncbi:MAG: pyruvate/oxaloacetate carboxyltransferase [Nitrospinota bacterium]
MAENRLKICELVLRDGHQSLLATRMKTEHMLPICEKLDNIGYWAIEMWGGATFDACIRFLNEDPWERVRKLKKLMPKTPFQMLLRGQNLVGYRHYADDLVRKFIDLSTEAGIDNFRIFDALNDLRNLETSIDQVKKNGKHAQGAISYTTSPVHNNQVFVDMAKRLEDAGCHSICIKDMAGLLAPSPAEELICAIKESVNLPLHLHTHTTSGYALLTMTKAIDSGIDIVDTVLSPLSMGASHSPTETIVSSLIGSKRDTGLDLDKIIEASEYFVDVKEEYSAFQSSFTGVDVNVLKSQVPGGMISNLESQLKQQNAIDKIQDVLKDLPETRRELGYPPLVTPTSQIVGTQAVLNVMMGRYNVISKEVESLIAGRYGKVPGTVDPKLLEKVCGEDGPITVRPADLLKPEWDALLAEVKSEHGIDEPEDVIIFALFPQIAKKYIENRGKPPTETFKKVEAPPATSTPAATTSSSNHFKVKVDGKDYDVVIDELSAISATPSTGASPSPSPVATTGGEPINSKLSGSVWKVLKKVGDPVETDETVIILEAMKMETEVKSDRAGVITTIDVAEGSAVQVGDRLFSVGG